MDVIPGLQEVEGRWTLGEKCLEDVFQVRAYRLEALQRRADILLEDVREDSAVMTLAQPLPESVPGQSSQVLLEGGGGAR
jgi:hypothetical protein